MCLLGQVYIPRNRLIRPGLTSATISTAGAEQGADRRAIMVIKAERIVDDDDVAESSKDPRCSPAAAGYLSGRA